MKFFLGKSSQQNAVDRQRLYKDFYEFKKTVLHGFPANPTCVAYDNYHHLLAIGTKNGSIQIYGKPGVEFHYQFENDSEIERILFISKHGQLLCLCSDYSIHLLKIPSEPSQTGITRLHSNNYFVNESEPISDNLTITTLSLNELEDTVFIGMKNGDICLLDMKTFAVKDDGKNISQDVIIKAIQEELKFKPGSVEVVEERPGHHGQILIGYSRCLIALWDYNNKTIVNYFLIEQQLEHLSWNRNGLDFISCHNDGSYNQWSAGQEHHNCKNVNSRLPYGPFPCKAIKKIAWHKCPKGDYLVFYGGMPRASYSDKETVAIIHHPNKDGNNTNSEKNIVLEFTSKVVDFVLVFSSDESHQRTSSPLPSSSSSASSSLSSLKALVVLTVEEIVVIDLEHPDFLQYKLPYLACLHSSPITCSQYCPNVQPSVYKRIIESSELETTVKYSHNEWPINGGVAPSSSDSTKSNDIVNHLLITGHEDGSVRFWDASTISLKHLYTVNTSKIFNVNEDDDIALLDGHEDHELSNDDDDQNVWPPFKKVGQFDPYSDDPRLAIRKLTFCPEKGILAVGGTAGQLLVFEFKDKQAEFCANFIEVKMIDEKDSFVWKGHGCLPARKNNVKFNVGFQPISLVQVHPPAAVTALTMSTCWQVISIGTAHGFILFDYSKNVSVAAKSTLKASNLVMGGDALISRRKSFKKSLRESFRRLRRSRSQKSKRNIAATGGNKQSQTKLQEANNRLAKFDQIEPKPIERPIEATKATEDAMTSSMVRYLYFCSSSIIGSQPCPTFWIGTNSGTLYIYVLTNDKNSTNTTSWQLAKEVQLKHKAPIVFIRLVDMTGIPLFEQTEQQQTSGQENQQQPNEKSTHRILICSEEQFKLFSLPNFKSINKFKLTAHEGARVRRVDMGRFWHKTNQQLSEYVLMVLTNLGDVNIFSSIDFKRKFQHHFIKKEDILGISSLLFTNQGEGFYQKSPSEYQRFSLTSRKIDFLECHIELPKIITSDQKQLSTQILPKKEPTIEQKTGTSPTPKETNLDIEPETENDDQPQPINVASFVNDIQIITNNSNIRTGEESTTIVVNETKSKSHNMTTKTNIPAEMIIEQNSIREQGSSSKINKNGLANSTNSTTATASNANGELAN